MFDVKHIRKKIKIKSVMYGVKDQSERIKN